jgi:hypothetical protein
MSECDLARSLAGWQRRCGRPCPATLVALDLDAQAFVRVIRDLDHAYNLAVSHELFLRILALLGPGQLNQWTQSGCSGGGLARNLWSAKTRSPG